MKRRNFFMIIGLFFLFSFLTYSNDSVKISPMDKNKFWTIVDNSYNFSKDISLALFRIQLNTLSPGELNQFLHIMGIYKEHVEKPNMKAVCYAVNGSCDETTVQDFAWWLISQGKDTYHTILKDPDMLSKFTVKHGEYQFKQFGRLPGEIMINYLKEDNDLGEFALSDDQTRELDKGISFRDEIKDEKIFFDHQKIRKDSIKEYIPKLYKKFILKDIR